MSINLENCGGKGIVDGNKKYRRQSFDKRYSYKYIIEIKQRGESQCLILSILTLIWDQYLFQ